MDMTSLVKAKRNPKIPDIAPGDTVRVHARIVEGGKERIQVFQGVILKIKGGGNGTSFTVRHVAYGIGVERTFPMYSPLVEKVEIVRQGKVRRSRLYYLRGLSGKEARRKIKRVERKARQVGEELIDVQPEEELEPEDVLMDEEAVAEAEAEAAEAETEEQPEVEEAEEQVAEVEEEPEAEVEKEPEAAVEEAEAEIEEKPEAAVEEPEAEVEERPEDAVEEDPTAEEEPRASAEEITSEEPVAEEPEPAEAVEEPTEEEPDKETT